MARSARQTHYECISSISLWPEPTAAYRGRTVAAVHADRIIGTTRAGTTHRGLAAKLGAVVGRHEVDAVAGWSLHHLGTTVDSRLETMAERNRHGGLSTVMPTIGGTVETDGLLAAAAADAPEARQ